MIAQLEEEFYYESVEGDSLRTLSQNLYGDESKAILLQQKNVQWEIDQKIPVGTKVVIQFGALKEEVETLPVTLLERYAKELSAKLVHRRLDASKYQLKKARIKKGESFERLAERLYGDSAKARELFLLNYRNVKKYAVATEEYEISYYGQPTKSKDLSFNSANEVGKETQGSVEVSQIDDGFESFEKQEKEKVVKEHVNTELISKLYFGITPSTLIDDKVKLSQALRDLKAKTGATLAKTAIREGESLQRLSRRLYGTTRRWKELFLLNHSEMDHPGEVYAGMEMQYYADAVIVEAENQAPVVEETQKESEQVKEEIQPFENYTTKSIQREPAQAGTRMHIVQIGSYIYRSNADHALSKLKEMGFPVIQKTIQHDSLGEMYLVRIPKQPDFKEAQKTLNQLKEKAPQWPAYILSITESGE